MPMVQSDLGIFSQKLDFDESNTVELGGKWISERYYDEDFCCADPLNILPPEQILSPGAHKAKIKKLYKQYSSHKNRRKLMVELDKYFSVYRPSLISSAFGPEKVDYQEMEDRLFLALAEYKVDRETKKNTKKKMKG